MVAANPQKLLGRNKKIQSEVDEQQQQLIASPINIAVSQNILKSLAKITELISQQNSQIVEIIREVKQSKSVDAKPQQQMIASPADTAALQDISKSLAKITQLLSQQNSQVTAEANQERKNQENARRKKIELGLENSFASVKNVAQSVIAPVKNILDSIIQFFVTLFLGRAILNLIDWFSKKENQSKIRSIARFLKDWWPALVAGYILFGTGFGRVVRNLASIGLRAFRALGGITLKLIGAIASALKFKKAGALLSGLGGRGGFRGLAARLGVGALVAGGGALAASKMMGGGDAPQVSIPEPATLPTAEAFGGGLIDFKTMLAASGGQVDSKLGIFAQLFGSGGFAGLLNSVPGVVSGPKGIDKVPAMLTDGEFVMSRGAVQKFGVSNLEAMNASGGGTNKPKIVQKRIHAFGGGFVGDDDLRRMAAKESVPTGGVSGSREFTYNSNNSHHVNNYEKLKKIAIKKGVYTPPTGAKANTYTSPNVKTNVNVNYKSSPKSSMARSPGQGLSTNVKPPVQRINTNMNVPGGRIRGGSLSAIMAAFEMKQRKDEGQTNVQAGLGAGGAALGGQLGWMGGAKVGAVSGAALGSIVPGLGTGVGGAVGAIVGGLAAGYGGAMIGGKLADDFSGVNAKKEGNDRGDGGMFQPGGMFGGPRMSARSDYAASKGKYYSSSDQKTYANENDALAARKSRMTSLASQQGLDKLSRKGANRSSQGVRFDAESKERNKDFEKRGGLTGQIGRGFTRMFGGGDQISKLDQQDKAATTKVKQSGAESIGRYYSSSDGKYYKDYNAASKARKARLATTPVKGKPITPTPKPAPKVYSPAGGGMGGGRGSGGGSKGTKLPTIPTGKDNSKTAKQLNIK